MLLNGSEESEGVYTTNLLNSGLLIFPTRPHELKCCILKFFPKIYVASSYCNYVLLKGSESTNENDLVDSDIRRNLSNVLLVLV